MKNLIINITKVFLLILFLAFLVVYSPIAILSSLVMVFDKLCIKFGDFFICKLGNLLDWLNSKINE